MTLFDVNYLPQGYTLTVIRYNTDIVRTVRFAEGSQVSVAQTEGYKLVLMDTLYYHISS